MIHRSAISGLKNSSENHLVHRLEWKGVKKQPKKNWKSFRKPGELKKKPSSVFLVNIKLRGARLLHSTAYTVQWYYCVHFPGSQFSQRLRVIWNHWSIEKSNMFFLCLNVGTKWSASFDLHQVGKNSIVVLQRHFAFSDFPQRVKNNCSKLHHSGCKDATSEVIYKVKSFLKHFHTSKAAIFLLPTVSYDKLQYLSVVGNSQVWMCTV